MATLIETARGRDQRDICSAESAPAALPRLNAAQRDMLLRWVRSEASTRTRAALLKSVDASIEHAELLCELLLHEGWLIRRERRSGGNWLWQSISWRDLPRLQALLGVTSASQRSASRQVLLDEAQAWLASRRQAMPADVLDPDFLDQLEQALHNVVQDKGLRLEGLAARVDLLRALAGWRDAGQQGLRRNFALQARGSTKALSNTEWQWLESCFDLEQLGIARFAPVIWLAGELALCWEQRRLELASLGFLGLLADDVARVDAALAPQRWWLIENRASFEQQARTPPPGVALLWMPGRPSRIWTSALSHLLQLAPAPAWISADADPSGVDIACAVGQLWVQHGLAWSPHLMGVSQWESTTQRWPLNDHDRRLLSRLLQRPTLPEDLRVLCQAMQSEGRKAEQEGWI